ncbi:MAG: urate hydroxylase PuuD [Gammaproteobacteria bacterium]|nr:urate hydroxylase PuuD [Gammaproteobacteria bacterium]
MDGMEVINFLARWGHIVFGIAWIGLLYYFNFIQGGFAAKASDEAKVELFTKLVPNALWYFRWAAMMTFLTGVYLVWYVHGIGTLGVDITLGAVMATIMFLNVWLIIWPNQKVVIASNESVAGGGSADPNQAGAAAKALLASRTNTFFSLPMLFFMVSSAHAQQGGGFDNMWGLIVGLVIIAAIELNAIFGKTGPLTTVKGVISSSVVLTVVMWAVVMLL